MGEIRVEEILDGDIIQSTVRNKEGEEILEKGTVLKKAYISLLQSLCVENVWIEERTIKQEKTEKKQPYVETKQQLFETWTEQLKNILEQHIFKGKNSLKKIETIAEIMVPEICREEEWRNLQGDFSNLYHHSVQETIYCLLLAEKEKMSEKQKKNIAIGSLLHDIGMRYITVDWKNRELDEMTPTEGYEYKKHTVLGYTALEEEAWVPEVARQMVLSHHERKDGKGYPLCQRSREIECKIIQIVDYYCTHISGIACITQKKEDVIKTLQKEAGIKFEKKLVEEFLNML